MGNAKNILKRNESAILTENGREILSPEPAIPIVAYKEADYELERIRSMVRREMSEVAQKHNMETFEEANDFDIDDGFEMEEPETRYMSEEYLNVLPAEAEAEESPGPDKASDSGDGVVGDEEEA